MEQGNFVYLLRCSDGSLYCGWTNNLSRRLGTHEKGRASRYTRSRLPVKLAWWAVCDDRSQAMRAEAKIKRMHRRQKQGLASTPAGRRWAD